MREYRFQLRQIKQNGLFYIELYSNKDISVGYKEYLLMTLRQLAGFAW